MDLRMDFFFFTRNNSMDPTSMEILTNLETNGKRNRDKWKEISNDNTKGRLKFLQRYHTSIYRLSALAYIVRTSTPPPNHPDPKIMQ